MHCWPRHEKRETKILLYCSNTVTTKSTKKIKKREKGEEKKRVKKKKISYCCQKKAA